MPFASPSAFISFDATVTKTFIMGRNSMVQIVLKKVWNIAICVPGSLNQLSNVTLIKSFQQIKRIKKINEPKKLNSKWIRLALFASVPALSEDKSEVTQEPMLEPSIKYNTAFPPPPIASPSDAIMIIIVVTAELL